MRRSQVRIRAATCFSNYATWWIRRRSPARSLTRRAPSVSRCHDRNHHKMKPHQPPDPAGNGIEPDPATLAIKMEMPKTDPQDNEKSPRNDSMETPIATTRIRTWVTSSRIPARCRRRFRDLRQPARRHPRSDGQSVLARSQGIAHAFRHRNEYRPTLEEVASSSTCRASDSPDRAMALRKLRHPTVPKC